MKVEFIKGHSFVGAHFSVKVNGVYYSLLNDRHVSYEEQAVKLLKEKYNLDFKVEDIKFQWNGTL